MVPYRFEKIIFLLIIVVLAITLTCFLPAIPQDTGYHEFADQRELFGIPNFWNVVSNIPFLIIGLCGFYFFKTQRYAPLISLTCLIFFIGIFFVGIGSAYYHFYPVNHSLVWDRLPMTIAFMAFLAFIISDYLSERSAHYLLWPLIGIGLVSVFYWQYTEAVGRGDLRLYVLVQFLPMLLIPLILLLFQPELSNNRLLWIMMSCYLLAKIFEFYDAEIFNWSGIMSGHTLKHFISSFSPLVFFYMLYKSTAK